MADSIAFTTACETLEGSTSLDRLEARGTVRLALKQAGLDAGTVSPSQLRVVVEKVLPVELESRGVDPGAIGGVISALNGLSDGGVIAGDSPEAIFSRLGK
jgi:hypothetical protein